MLFRLFGRELQLHKSRKTPSKAVLRDIELQMERVNIIISKIDSMAWVAKRFAEEQQLKDAEEDRYDDRSEASSMERPRWRPPPPRGFGRQPFVAEQQCSEGGRPDYEWEAGSLYEVEATRRPVRPRDDRGNRYHSHRGVIYTAETWSNCMPGGRCADGE
jgi:hypothetical protein